jgi:hypothetical protein
MTNEGPALFKAVKTCSNLNLRTFLRGSIDTL